MKRLSLVTAVALLAMSFAFLLTPTTATAHGQENFVDWTVAYANIDFTSPPTWEDTADSTAVSPAPGDYPRIELATGDRLVITYTFDYIGDRVRRGDLFWVTRLGLDFGTIGKYVDPNFGDPAGDPWLGGGSFELRPGTTYDATLVLRAIQPTFRHLHVGVSIQDVGNIPAAPTVGPEIPAGGPPLYGVFTEARGPVAEPLGGMNVNVPGFGELKLIETWPWALGGLVAQIFLGIGFILLMYWYGRREAKRAGGGT